MSNSSKHYLYPLASSNEIIEHTCEDTLHTWLNEIVKELPKYVTISERFSYRFNLQNQKHLAGNTTKAVNSHYYFEEYDSFIMLHFEVAIDPNYNDIYPAIKCLENTYGIQNIDVRDNHLLITCSFDESPNVYTREDIFNWAIENTIPLKKFLDFNGIQFSSINIFLDNCY